MVDQADRLPPELARRAVEVHGAAGRDWLARLPALLEACARRWELRLAPPFDGLTYNYAAPAQRADGAPVVLKLCCPVKEFFTEAAALEIFDGRGCVRLLASDLDAGALLLERAEPGAALTTVADDETATAAAVAVMRQLWRPVPADHRFPTVADWGRGFERLRARFGGGSGPLPARLVDEAERLFADLLASAVAPVVLHGDLHHGNILRARRGLWLAIDPKGLVGEPAYEPGALLRNPLPGLLDLPDPGGALTRRIDQLAEALGHERERIRGWAMAQAVLSAWWSIEDHGRGWEAAIACAEHLKE